MTSMIWLHWFDLVRTEGQFRDYVKFQFLQFFAKYFREVSIAQYSEPSNWLVYPTLLELNTSNGMANVNFVNWCDYPSEVTALFDSALWNKQM